MQTVWLTSRLSLRMRLSRSRITHMCVTHPEGARLLPVLVLDAVGESILSLCENIL
ncbi:MAG: hypothetical protein GFH27_549297n190 [Chloroflexi bacterium AL-W]|nr:hypothetical protein [Chloroflexi bacterium AL-N1]NOK68956.1 hypothetical protein [Chloroflexi bacterium AL-N10]NOK76939.1 hypothetical protein [Chloroflexi bacterium AL-N5]NOK82673.1 hypothetical protein [Chloroflexi bacterium AL-W]NOK90796.1 hypothetical protein [Chloroflexi bacterium AL-N15]